MIIVPITESGRRLDFLAKMDGEFLRVRIYIPYGKAIMFSASVFHGGAPGRLGKEDRSLHCNIERPGNNQEFQKYFLHKFRTWKGKNFFQDGICKANGKLDNKRLLESGCSPLSFFENSMIGLYDHCVEAGGIPLPPGAVFKSCTYEEFKNNNKNKNNS